MDNIKTTALYQNIQIDIIKQLGEGCLTDMVLDVVMPMFEPFIEERLSNFELYREAIEKANRPIIVTNWKPSKEQMKWLKDVIETVPMTCRQQIPLESLYADLQKLIDAEKLKSDLEKQKEQKPNWKPSEEQMADLCRAERRLRIEGESVLANKLAELWEQLRKLRYGTEKV